VLGKDGCSSVFLLRSHGGLSLFVRFDFRM
jgi:hypothetical protein